MSTYPTATLATPFGPILLTVTGKDRLGIEAHHNTVGAITVNRVAYNLAASLDRDGDRFDLPKREHGYTDWSAWHMRRAEWHGTRANDQYPPHKTNQRAMDTILPLVSAWAAAHPQAFTEAETINLVNAITFLRRQHEQKHAELTRLGEEICLREQELAALSATPATVA